MQIEALLERHGLPLLGVAHTAFAFEHAGDAIKVGFDVEDGWPAWAEWCSDHPSPHVPRIRVLQWVLDDRGGRVLFVAQVERLFPSLTPRLWIKRLPAAKRDPLALADLITADHPAIAALLHGAAAAFPAGHWDMGGPNWLERADGTIVLNDPLSRSGGGANAALTR